MLAKALASGGSVSNDAQDVGWMYTQSFQDRDGRLWEIAWMDPAGMPSYSGPRRSSSAAATAHVAVALA
ncbi:VOC family protein [Arthrobacter cavernae]|uniref:Glyoxalase n=1 Tax=Arthrobacter cavernae TaxID=2817681 RepID=A0A939HIJ4_9MICC|nr:hypothetical protein [Arthrobacter cavernae]MBO1268481.1 hypothetical protein [Arthrobacter cavernae]